MALIARVLNVTFADNTRGNPMVEIGFYDDTLPANQPLPTTFLERRVYPTKGYATVTAFTDVLKADGAQIRTDNTRAQAVVAALPIGAQLTVP